MNDRFGWKDLPHILRRQLQEAKQGSDESLEEFADKVQELATDGYPESPDYFIQIVAVDAFLKGCAEKQAALVAMDKNPSSLDEATQYMKSAITNQRLIMGSRKTTDIKRVTFEDPAELKDSDAVIRAIYREKPQLESSKMDIRVKKNEDDIQEMKKSLSQILNILKGKDERSRSPIAFRKSSPAPSPDRKRLENSTCFACGNLAIEQTFLLEIRLRGGNYLIESTNIGSFKYNVKIRAEGQGNLIVCRRPSKETLNSVDFLQCLYCNGYYGRKELWRHTKKCAFNKNKNKSQLQDASIIVRSKLVLAGGLSPYLEGKEIAVPKELKETCFIKMYRDQIFDNIVNDILILQYGKFMVSHLGPVVQKCC
ncbi:Hypothetical predicted protein [Mytilus galloprovincialis]|uniref:Uncharacterized protein n=1 Tax=Mytilus galloprovincialis TaxID=29158 RepID=A0A8B6DY21_MYTGA|nr:Hypothetical predicted protein [Mytilus galloprovincialis]